MMYRWFVFPNVSVMLDFTFADWNFDLASVWNDIVTGILLTGLIGLSFIVLMSFADFLRSYWMVNRRRRNLIRNAERAMAARNQPAAPPLQMDELELLLREHRARNPPERAPVLPEGNMDVLEPRPQPAGPRDNNLQRRMHIQHDNDDAVEGVNDQQEQEHEEGADDADDDFNLPHEVHAENDEREELEVLQDEDLAALLNENFPVDDAANDANEAGNGVRENANNHQPPVDGEVRINVFEMLGLRGPLFAVVRYALWVVAFNVFCLLVGMFIPSCLGDVFILIFKPYAMILIRFVGSLFPEHVVEAMVYTWNSLITPSAANKIIRLSDILLTFVGYAGGAVVVYLLSHIGSGIKYIMYNHLTRSTSVFFTTISALKDVIKIGSLLGVRIFVMPCIIGCMVLRCANIIVQYPISVFLDWAGNNIIGAIAVSWGIGIAYMLCTTIAILQLREVLHPELLARYIRPQESQTDLLNSLLVDSMAVQLRRLVVSFLVYVFLIALFVWVPVVGFKAILCLTSPIPIYTWYIVPEIQAPLEVAVLHTVFLMMLEKHKDSIGHAEHHGLLYLSTKLGVNRFLLPYFAKPISSEEERLQAQKGNKEIVVVRGSLKAVVGQPMRRPPPGWDARTRMSTTRWAWNASQATDLERLVAPRVFPSFFIIRILLVVAVCWLAVVLASAAITILPLSLGRLMAYLLLIPQAYIHDPVCILIGYLVIFTSRRYIQSLCALKAVFKLPLLSMDRKTLLTGCYCALMWGVLFPYFIGLSYFALVYPLVHVGNRITYITLEISIACHIQCFVLGSVVLNWVSILIFSGAIDRIMTRLGYLPLFDNWTYAIGATWNSIVNPGDTCESQVTAARTAINNGLKFLVEPVAQGFTFGMWMIVVIEWVACLFHKYLRYGLRDGHPIVARHIVKIYVCYFAYVALKKPLEYWCRWYYHSIKDENYLVGMELQNSDQGLKNMKDASGQVQASPED
eukprot:CAMPEP_0185020942 /NCGR_PEP_ID=MMETSP1103-20130426/3590_1 /TAXON_ID=36769 /ORGANISM="Paraphysomonas bandaiensis, Strain Caron Lab Isolate" /LENGTH=969 /DNA_ID=CAMNT_0027552163 /DNA_START=333 /DNA_END=3242 /DNA_ORIENTATION=+